MSMHTKGHGFKSFPAYFSKDNAPLEVNELATLLKRIAWELPRLSITLSEFAVPERLTLPVISQLTKEVIALDAK